ncbi:hypothetical protein CHS0354_012430 [Potamilus streckersoni]|uniref:CUB domain-containing protein n=1 Tax=Potamilus streckersoni TaxID=2493646 RepID=A0AAE0RVE7_9BIVA|nr:hypothetical protein CHS0354_012430 [Potamilus streckersoni]
MSMFQLGTLCIYSTKVVRQQSGRCSDFLKLFLNIDRPEVNEHSKWDEVLCGNISNLKQKTYFSSSRSLILEYHTASKSSGHFTGFRGTFKFFNQADFRNDGHKQLGTQCSYFFQSSNNGTKGKFFSPRYPQNYPKDSNCQYIFMGHAKEKVIVRFQNIQLDNRESSCRSNPDTVRVYDGNQRDGKILREICGIHNQVDVMSSGQYMYIEFKSDHYHESQGFAATFEFTDDANLYTPQPPPQKNGETRSSSDNFTSCNMKIFSANAKNGTIESHSYPHPYPPSIRCQYELEGQGQERVQLSFKKMNLYYSGGDPDMPHGCINQDSISVFIYIDGKEILLGQYCGNKSPSQLMSNNQRMKVVFTSTSQSETRNVFGFQLEYNFRTDFGVQGSGIQDPRKGCLFHYNSTSSKVGFFTSPNFPGQYPPYTECNYQFHGLGKLKEERVFITFDDFYVGESGCEKSTESDYVSFSNFLGSGDRQLPRLCGQMNPGQVIRDSEGAFFRMTFKSNHIYDATGFKANYRFVPVNEILTPTMPNPEPETSRGTSISPGTSHDHVTVVMGTVYLLFLTVIFHVL